ncbi:hypothetical protein KAR91_57830 [Candidatus Pacearchaeota archaeon]|nr:hypothetical protein [Candidatus Pacearchaeota archaeon]
MTVKIAKTNLIDNSNGFRCSQGDVIEASKEFFAKYGNSFKQHKGSLTHSQQMVVRVIEYVKGRLHSTKKSDLRKREAREKIERLATELAEAQEKFNESKQTPKDVKTLKQAQEAVTDARESYSNLEAVIAYALKDAKKAEAQRQAKMAQGIAL